MKTYDKTIFEVSTPGKVGYRLPEIDVETSLDAAIPAEYLREKTAKLPMVSETEVYRHFFNLSKKNYSVDEGMYPLGSCTMKYNPKINEEMAGLSGFVNTHPYQDEATVQGNLELLYNLQESLKEISGMNHVSLHPAAGAHGEITGIMLIKAYHEKRGDNHRNVILVPDSAHGTNPATATMAGYKIREIPSTPEGTVDVEALKALADDHTAGLMLTNPNTVGMFEKDIAVISEIVHDAGGLLYYDGANMNAILGKVRPGDMGFDVVHFNLHKTFSTPHGGGGPGAGPIGCIDALAPFLPVPLVVKSEQGYAFDYERSDTIGKVKDFYGHFAILVRAYSYILTMGSDGLQKASEIAVLSANYIQEALKKYFDLPVDRACMHEFVLSHLKNNPEKIKTFDVAKRLLDYGFHAPTVYFPTIIEEALMIEPTETESKENIDAFIDAMISIAKEAAETPELLKNAPLTTEISRPDETRAARNPILVYRSEDDEV